MSKLLRDQAASISGLNMFSQIFPIALAIFALVVLFLFYIFWPLVQKTDQPFIKGVQKDFDIENRAWQKRELVTELKDLKLDYQMKKISGADYQSQYAQILAKADQLLKDDEK